MDGGARVDASNQHRNTEPTPLTWQDDISPAAFVCRWGRRSPALIGRCRQVVGTRLASFAGKGYLPGASAVDSMIAV